MNSRTPNNNFLEEEVEYEEVPEDQISEADEILEEVEEEIEQEQRVTAQTMKALSEAEKRIEQANLYKAILNSNLFSPNSARPEIIKIVDKEFKEFVMYRLEVLLGIKADGRGMGQAVEPIKLPFSQVEIQALRAIAAKLIQKQGPVSPSVQQVSAPQPTVQQITNQPAPMVQQVQDPQYQPEPEQDAEQTPAPRMVKRVVRRTVNGQQVQAAPAKKARTPRPKTQNVSVITGQDLGQASNPLRPPIPMPTQAHMNALNAEQAAKNARAKAQESGALAQALNILIK